MEGLFRGTWYRSAVKLERDRILPVPPFESYNPFERYYSAAEVRQGERSLYLEFLSVNAEKPEEVLCFSQRFGLLGDPEKAKGQVRKEIKRTHQEFWEKFPADIFSRRKREEGLKKMEHTITPAMGTPGGFCFPLTIPEFKNAQLLFRHQIESTTSIDLPSVLQATHPKISPPENKALLSDTINSNLTTALVIPNVQWNVQENRWELVWLSLSLLGYLWLMLALDQVGPGKILSCPRCQNWFVTASNRMRFCSPRCYENFKVQKYQQKKKVEALAKQFTRKKK